MPAVVHGTNYTNLMHIVDVMPTLLSAANVSADLLPHFHWDGVDHWAAMTRGRNTNTGERRAAVGVPAPVPPRSEVLIQLDNLALVYKGQRGDGPKAAIRKGKWKLMLGPPGCPNNVFRPEDVGKSKYDCVRLPDSSVLLFDLEADPGESKDVSAANPGVVAQLKARIAFYNETAVSAFYPDNDPEAAPSKHDGNWAPWVSVGVGDLR